MVEFTGNRGVSDLSGLPLFAKPRAETGERQSSLQPKHWTVSELTSRIRGVIEPAFTQVWVQGEVSNYRPAASAHVYFSLKDANACISAAAFGWGSRKRNAGPSFELKDGLQVLCRGKISLYPPRGTYQLVVDQIEPLGAGALQIAFEQLKAKLAGEGLFNAEIKRPLPRFPRRVAVITSPTGAAIQDMLTILRRRAIHLRVTIIPALVQGTEAAPQMIRALQLANEHALGDVIVLARGGGSIEDLWCFNDENLARAIRASRLPVISAVGHEIDFTISDFVSDLRAPTPSAAAEIVSSAWVDVPLRLQDAVVRLTRVMSREIENRKNLLSHLAARVVSPQDRLREKAQKVDDLALRLERAMKVRVDRQRAGLQQLVGRLDALSPLRVLERGYTLIRDPAGNDLVKSAKQVQSGQCLEITFFDGQRRVEAL